MNDSFQIDFMRSSIKLFEYYKDLADRSIAQLEDKAALFQMPAKSSNSIAIIMKHISGNIKSRWTDLFTSDGEKPWRQRDLEFVIEDENPEPLVEEWNNAWKLLFKTLESIDSVNFNNEIIIRNTSHTVVEAIQRQLAHYSYHVGQIVYLSRLFAKDWKSLSIPKGESNSFNKLKFEADKSRLHFTDTLLDRE